MDDQIVKAQELRTIYTQIVKKSGWDVDFILLYQGQSRTFEESGHYALLPKGTV